MYNFIVTGGCGFIGSHFIELLLSNGYTVLNIDKMTYVSWSNIGFENNPNYNFWKQDICDITNLPKCDYLVNFAAESFVDNSIENSEIFFRSNVQGVHNLLEHIRMKAEFDRPIFVQISTDEVYGDTLDETFCENDVLRPSNPYSATKAAAEQLVFAYNRTYGVQYLITRASNNYGIRQYPEKLIPKTIMSILTDRKMTIHGDGSYIRSWIHVKDNCNALLKLIENNCYNEIYNICSGEQFSNLDLVKMIYNLMDNEPNLAFVENRWGQDLRYSISVDKIKDKVKWEPHYTLKESLNEIINFYKENNEINS